MSEETTENMVEETPPVAEQETEAALESTNGTEAPAAEAEVTEEAPTAEVVEAVEGDAAEEAPTADATEAVEGDAAEEAPTADATEAVENDTVEEVSVGAEQQSATSSVNIADLKPAMELQGTIKRIELYGAFVDVGVGKDALLHISQLGKPNVRNVEDVVKQGETITVYVLKVDAENERIALSLEKPPERPINRLEVGEVVTGEVVRIENFGVFVEIGAERPGMIHVSELAVGFVKSPEDIVTVGGEVQAKIIKVNRKKRQIDLSIKALEEEQTRADAAAAAEDADDEPMPTAMEMALRRAMDEVDETPEGKAKADRRQRNSRKRRDALSDALSRTLREHGD
jgi:small subunit ribosomal protein S1